MSAPLADSGAAINRFLSTLHPRSRDTVNVYRCILVEFQRHVQQCPRNTAICQLVDVHYRVVASRLRLALA